MIKNELWFITGSQHLYGPQTLEQVALHSQKIAAGLDADETIPAKVLWQPVVKTADEISNICRAANTSANCIGLVMWMHTFSPAKMWIAGLSALEKPFVHLHTQFNRDIPWAEIDMDFMNLNQSAHGGREFGFVCSRLGIRRTVIVGHWQDSDVRRELSDWTRAAGGWSESRRLKVARFGDNMRGVAVTEGDKVAAQIKFGYSVDGFGLGDLKPFVNAVADGQIDDLMEEYKTCYDIAPAADTDHIREQARLEIGIRSFLEEGGFKAFTTNFEDLDGLKQLPGLAAQRLMADGYGFGAEGDWKTAAMMRIAKVIGDGLAGGTSFMEDYTYHFHPDGMLVLGAHMLELCPSIAAATPSLETHRLVIGGREDPARLVFNVSAGPAVNMSTVAINNHFRIVVNELETVTPEQELPKLPVARALWTPLPDLRTAATAWILAGGGHHTVFSQQVSARQMEVFCEIADIEMLLIDEGTNLRDFKKELRYSKTAF
jgi:L-arabinose isomerase